MKGPHPGAFAPPLSWEVLSLDLEAKVLLRAPDGHRRDPGLLDLSENLLRGLRAILQKRPQKIGRFLDNALSILVSIGRKEGFGRDIGPTRPRQPSFLDVIAERRTEGCEAGFHMRENALRGILGGVTGEEECRP